MEKDINIEGYQLGRQLSDRKFCSIYNALDLTTNKTVTVRIFRPSLLEDQDFCKSIQKLSDSLENKVLGKIIPILKAEVKSDLCYVITEYFPCSLDNSSLIKDLKPVEILQLCQQLASSLDLYHQQGYVHGAVNKGNVYFRDSNEFYLGLSAFYRVLNQDVTHDSGIDRCDDPAYLAPEAGEGLTAFTDYYALGVVIFELLFNRRPFETSNLKKMENKKRKMDFDFESSLFLQLKPFFNRLLAVDPDHRISNARQFNEALVDCGFEIEFIQYDKGRNVGYVDTQIKSRQKMVYLVAGTAAIFLSLYMAYPIIPEKNSSQKRVTIPSDTSEGLKRNKISKNVLSIDSGNNLELIKQIETDIENKEFKFASSRLDKLRKVAPDNEKIPLMISMIERGVQVEKMLKRAQELIELGNIIQPEGDNAVEIYHALEKYMHPSDPRILNGYELINEALVSKAKVEMARGNVEVAKSLIVSGLDVSVNYQPLVEMKNKLDLMQKNEEAKSKKDKVVDKKVVVAAPVAPIKRESKTLRIDIVKQESEEKKAAEKKQYERNKRLEKLILKAQNTLNHSPRSVENIYQVESIYQVLKREPVDSLQIEKLKVQIVEYYLALVGEYTRDGELNESLKVLELALQFSPDNFQLKRQQKSVNELLEANLRQQNLEKEKEMIKQKEKTITTTVFGTF